MNRDTYENSLVELDNSILGKVKLFFRKLFNPKSTEYSYNQPTTERQQTNFMNDIKIPEKKQNLRLECMRRDLESGKIIEEDLCEQELQELREWYMQQIQEKKASIENYKNRILKIKAQLN